MHSYFAGYGCAALRVDMAQEKVTVAGTKPAQEQTTRSK
jgi:hypothetical protein